MRDLVLASSSAFRKSLLDRLGYPYTALSPDIDEQRFPEETPSNMVKRLSRAKARAIASVHPKALIIGSDQCAVIDGEIAGKPGNRERAYAQLRAASGRSVSFHTGVCLLDAQSGQTTTDIVTCKVHFRPLSDAQIERYLERDRPYQCAGSIRSEQLGIALFERLEGDDPTALMGLPLIRLVAMLETAGVSIP